MLDNRLTQQYASNMAERLNPRIEKKRTGRQRIFTNVVAAAISLHGASAILGPSQIDRDNGKTLNANIHLAEGIAEIGAGATIFYLDYSRKR